MIFNLDKLKTYRYTKYLYCLLFIGFAFINPSIQQQQLQDRASSLNYDSHQIVLKTEPITLDLYHKFGTTKDFKLRGSILIKPKTEYRVAQATILQQNELSEADLKDLRQSYEQADNYYLKAILRPKKNSVNQEPSKITQTLIRSCSLLQSNLADFVEVNLSPTNEFFGINLFTTDPECSQEVPGDLSKKFNTTILVESNALGPIPDTATYVKRLEEERSNKAKEGKEDNRSFFAKYWVYIVPAVVVLMMFSGPGEPGAGR